MSSAKSVKSASTKICWELAEEARGRARHAPVAAGTNATSDVSQAALPIPLTPGANGNGAGAGVRSEKRLRHPAQSCAGDGRAPHVVVLGGPNDAGKSTAAPSLLHARLRVSEFVDADTIARGLAALPPEFTALEAARCGSYRRR